MPAHGNNTLPHMRWHTTINCIKFFQNSKAKLSIFNSQVKKKIIKGRINCIRPACRKDASHNSYIDYTTHLSFESLAEILYTNLEHCYFSKFVYDADNLYFQH
jgi:hypothetical protein